MVGNREIGSPNPDGSKGTEAALSVMVFNAIANFI